jgi:hypothetical protein
LEPQSLDFTITFGEAEKSVYCEDLLGTEIAMHDLLVIRP